MNKQGKIVLGWTIIIVLLVAVEAIINIGTL